jgi:hypothetical protein
MFEELHRNPSCQESFDCLAGGPDRAIIFPDKSERCESAGDGKVNPPVACPHQEVARRPDKTRPQEQRVSGGVGTVVSQDQGTGNDADARNRRDAFPSKGEPR